MKVFLSDDKSSFTMQGRIWTQTFKIESLRTQIDLYTRLTKRRGGERPLALGGQLFAQEKADPRGSQGAFLGVIAEHGEQFPRTRLMPRLSFCCRSVVGPMVAKARQSGVCLPRSAPCRAIGSGLPRPDPVPALRRRLGPSRRQGLRVPGRSVGLAVPAGAGFASVAASGGSFWSCRLGQDHARLASMILTGSLALPVGGRGLFPTLSGTVSVYGVWRIVASLLLVFDTLPF